MNSPPHTVLLIEDNPGDARLIREMLAEDPDTPFRLHCAERLSHGLDFLLTYTYSKALTDTEGGSVPANSYDVRADYAPASWDRTNTLTFEHNWDIPVGRDRYWKLNNNAVANAVLGGWRLSGSPSARFDCARRLYQDAVAEKIAARYGLREVLAR